MQIKQIPLNCLSHTNININVSPTQIQDPIEQSATTFLLHLFGLLSCNGKVMCMRRKEDDVEENYFFIWHCNTTITTASVKAIVL